ncbi:penicillin acylase family protein [Angustibacter sp. McL0619]|uniref:penicillin acylase family protein n=1 Tax=Angustibacter sp. McL0619 TaxID=3415676 RepID=UPI003CE9D0A9
MARLNPLIRTVVIVCAALLVVALVASIALVTSVRRSFPDRGGEADVPGLHASVSVVRDGQGVPQLYADNADDLFAAQGYVQAQDRFFEMDLRRHITAGRLSELVGESKDALDADKVVRTLGWRRVAEAELPMLSATTRQYLQAYADGVNAYISGRSTHELGVEYAVLDLQLPDYRVEPWTPVDSLAWLKAMAWDLKTNYDDEITRARLSAYLSPRRIEQLYPPYPTDRNAPILAESTTSQSASAVPPGTLRAADAASGRSALALAQKALDSVPALMGRGDGIGSNSWVVSGRMTKSGKPLLANDPHLAPAVPSLWYQMGLHCRQVNADCPFDVAGFTFSGTPGVIIGHNAKVAWGLTNLGPDVTDLYLERVAGDSVEYDGVYAPLQTRAETIKVRGGKDVPLTVRTTRHGPLLSDVLADVKDAGREEDDNGQDAPTYDVALAWTALSPGRTADAIFAIDRATDWDQFRAAAAQFEVPSQNLVYADVDGNIGYQAPGKVPVRAGYDGRWPVPGWSSKYRWASYVPFSEMPHVLNPADGFVVTANQQVQASELPFLTEDWSYGYRSQRIRDLLTGRTGLTAADMSAIQFDNRNGMAPTLVPLLLATDLKDDPFTREAQDLLRGWDYTQPPDSAAAAYYNAVWRNLMRLGFDDELGDDLQADGGDRWFEVVTTLVKRKSDPWWDNKATPGAIENRDEIIRQAMVAARLELTRDLGKDVSRWQWGRLHRLELTHSPLGGPTVWGPVRAMFNRGPVELGGGSALVDATGWNAAEGYQVSWVPSMRMVVDLSDLDKSTWVNLTGASGHPFDAHYNDQNDHWATGRTYPWPFSQQAVLDAKSDELVLNPQK